jgi:hypothetical protein
MMEISGRIEGSVPMAWKYVIAALEKAEMTPTGAGEVDCA